MSTREARDGIAGIRFAAVIVLGLLVVLAAGPTGGEDTARGAGPPATADGLPSQGATSTIQPGDPLVGGDGEPYCTLNYVFDSDTNDSVYVATAGHCVSGVGERLHTRGHPGFGTVAFVGGQGVTEDYALIEVQGEARSSVVADVRGHPGTPTSVATPGNTTTGQPVTMSGWGWGANLIDTTRETRAGIVVGHAGALVRVLAPGTPGDSGGPWTLMSGPALGILSQAGASYGVHGHDVPTPGEDATVPLPSAYAGYRGPSILALLDGAAAAGYDVSLRTAG